MTFAYHSPRDGQSLAGYDEIRSDGEGLAITAVATPAGNGWVWVPYHDLPALIEGLLTGPADGDDGEPAETAQDRDDRFRAMAAAPPGEAKPAPVNLLTLIGWLLHRHLSGRDFAQWTAEDRAAVDQLLTEITEAAGHLQRRLIP